MGVGDVGNIVLRDRKNLAEDGIITIVVAINRESRTIMSRPGKIKKSQYIGYSFDLVSRIL